MNLDFLKHKVNLDNYSKGIKAQIDELQRVGAKAKTLLDSSDFCEFRSDFDQCLKDSITFLLEYDEPDPVKYKLEIKNILIRIKVLRDFITSLENKKGALNVRQSNS